ncbi:hypothetical protein V8D89_014487 [Ganoderma adspersum]
MPNSTALVAHDIEQLDILLLPAWYYMDVACIALTVYEHLLSFDAELRVIWGRKLNLPNILFLLNRYLLVLFSLSLILWSLVKPYESDRMAGILNFTVSILMPIVGGVFSSLRIHAINGQRWIWTSLIFLLVCATAPYDLAGLLVERFHTFKGTDLPIVRGCNEAADHLDYASWNRGAVAVQACSLISSAIDVGITWYRTKDIICVKRTTRGKPSLASSMLQSDLFLNIIQFYFLVTSDMPTQRGVSLAKFSVTIDSILMSRFILNLRLLDSQDPALDISIASRLQGLPTLSLRSHWPSGPSGGGPISARVLANIGAPLDFDEEPEDGDEPFSHLESYEDS